MNPVDSLVRTSDFLGLTEQRCFVGSFPIANGGDSGSWFLNEGGHVGAVMVGQNDLEVAYGTDIAPILGDIEESLKCTVSFPGVKKANPLVTACRFWHGTDSPTNAPLRDEIMQDDKHTSDEITIISLS